MSLVIIDDCYLASIVVLPFCDAVGCGKMGEGPCALTEAISKYLGLMAWPLDLTSESKEQGVSRLVTLRSRRILRYITEDSAYQQRSGSHLRPRKTQEMVCHPPCYSTDLS